MGDSIPEIWCERCEFVSARCRTWGAFYYRWPDGSMQSVRRREAWCFQCGNIEAVEDLSDRPAVSERILEQKQSLKRVAQRFGFRRFGFHRQEYLDALIHLWGVQARAALLAGRQSPPRCLRCGSTMTSPVVIPHVAPGEIRSLGFMHPNCGGDLLVRAAPWQTGFPVQRMIYDTEGNFLSSEPVVPEIASAGIIGRICDFLFSTTAVFVF